MLILQELGFQYHTDGLSRDERHPGVVFLKEDEIARFALSSPLTIRGGETW
jgi:hypothetical protein